MPRKDVPLSEVMIALGLMTKAMQRLTYMTKTCLACAAEGRVVNAKYHLTRHCGCPADADDATSLCGAHTTLMADLYESQRDIPHRECGKPIFIDEPQLITRSS